MYSIAQERARSCDSTHRGAVSHSLGNFESHAEGGMKLHDFTFSPLRALYLCKRRAEETRREETTSVVRGEENKGQSSAHQQDPILRKFQRSTYHKCSSRFPRSFTSLPRKHSLSPPPHLWLWYFTFMGDC